MAITVRVQTEADLATTWDRLSDINHWPSWNPACAEAFADPPLNVGTRLRLRLRHPRGRLFWTEPRITEMNAPTDISWTVHALGVRAPLTIHCDELPSGGTAITLETHSTGILGFAYRLVFPEKTQGLIWSGTLTALARSFRTESPSPTALGAASSDHGAARSPRRRGPAR